MIRLSSLLLVLVLLGLSWPAQVMAAEGPPLLIPSSEPAADWIRAWGEVVSHRPGGMDGVQVAVKAQGDGWLLEVHDRAGVIRSAPVAVPTCYEDRLDLLYLAVSLAQLRSGLSWDDVATGMPVSVVAPPPVPPAVVQPAPVRQPVPPPPVVAVRPPAAADPVAPVPAAQPAPAALPVPAALPAPGVAATPVKPPSFRDYRALYKEDLDAPPPRPPSPWRWGGSLALALRSATAPTGDVRLDLERQGPGPFVLAVGLGWQPPTQLTDLEAGRTLMGLDLVAQAGVHGRWWGVSAGAGAVLRHYRQDGADIGAALSPLLAVDAGVWRALGDWRVGPTVRLARDLRSTEIYEGLQLHLLAPTSFLMGICLTRGRGGEVAAASEPL